MDLISILEDLCTATGIAGEENEVANRAMQFVRPYAEEVHMDEFHNVIARIRKADENQPTVLLDAHIDEIGMIVTYIDDKGFLHVANCGGVDRRLLLGQEVQVFTNPPIQGVVATIPPHLSGGKEKKVPEMDDVLIDIGMTKEEAEQVVSLGDRVGIRSAFHKLLGNRVASKALDDRSCVAIILDTLQKLKTKKLHCGLSVLFSAQEETGEIGAKIAGYSLNPDIAIALDVSFAYTPDANEFKCGKMGKGVMIGIAPTLSKDLSNELIGLAKGKGIPHQIEVMGGSTGTNADALAVIRGGVRTGLLSLPQKYMHTPVEVVDLQDMDSTSELLAAYIETIGGDTEC